MFFDDNLLIYNDAGKALYNKVKALPIMDYHCHLDQNKIANNDGFSDIGELWLAGDHYKWRAMRMNGVDEHYITGDASFHEKFLKYAEIVPNLIGNPLYYWTHLELKQVFDIDIPLNKDSAESIYALANEKLKDITVQGLLNSFNVQFIATTDDPVDDLSNHKKYGDINVTPTFRPDKLVNIEKIEFLPYIEANGLNSYEKVIAFIGDRIKFFHENGCRLSDHAFEYVPFAIGDAKAVFEKRIKGEKLTADEVDTFKTAVLAECAKHYTELEWTMQLHIGALRNNNAKMFEALADASININMISTSEIKVSVLIAQKDAERAVVAIHDKFHI